jgi:hypothetical protein
MNKTKDFVSACGPKDKAWQTMESSIKNEPFI